MAIIHGPEHPDKFRTQDRYKRRWYVDPLPADGTWDAWDGEAPAITTLKSAWSKEFKKRLPSGQTVKLDAYRAALYVADNIDHVRKAVKDDRHAAVATIATSADLALSRAGRRGTDVHLAAEWRANNMPVDPHMFSEDARPYLPVIDQFVADLRPVFLYSEVVGIRRDWWGCTVDTVIEIDGTTYVADWKTRAEDSQHGAYEEEACQIGANARCDYYITRQNGGAVRIPVPHLDRGLIISLRPDGYEMYPIELEPAADGAEALRACWVTKAAGQKSARDAIGRPLHPSALRPVDAIAESLADIAVVADWLRDRVRHLIENYPAAADDLVRRWPAVPTLKQGGHTIDQLNLIADICDRVEADHQIPFGASNPRTAA